MRSLLKTSMDAIFTEFDSSHTHIMRGCFHPLLVPDEADIRTVSVTSDSLFRDIAFYVETSCAVGSWKNGITDGYGYMTSSEQSNVGHPCIDTSRVGPFTFNADKTTTFEVQRKAQCVMFSSSTSFNFQDVIFAVDPSSVSNSYLPTPPPPLPMPPPLDSNGDGMFSSTVWLMITGGGGLVALGILVSIVGYIDPKSGAFLMKILQTVSAILRGSQVSVSETEVTVQNKAPNEVRSSSRTYDAAPRQIMTFDSNMPMQPTPSTDAAFNARQPSVPTNNIVQPRQQIPQPPQTPIRPRFAYMSPEPIENVEFEPIRV